MRTCDQTSAEDFVSNPKVSRQVIAKAIHNGVIIPIGLEFLKWGLGEMEKVISKNEEKRKANEGAVVSEEI